MRGGPRWGEIRWKAQILLGLNRTAPRPEIKPFMEELVEAFDLYGLRDPPVRGGRRGDWTRVKSGGRFYPHDARVNEVELEDIWWALSLICRYNGHCDRFYSVLTHSIMVAHMVREPELAAVRGRVDLNVLTRCALLHDGTEAYLGDVIRPLKKYLPGYSYLETRVARVIGRRVGLGDSLAKLNPAIKVADNLALAVEARDIVGDPPDWTIPYADQYPGLIARYRCDNETFEESRRRARALWEETAP